ncbi:MAG: type II toxin-antitoxin system prevent-host-death family antitoxin [Melioribacteraceae bacterium]|nr:type II toxin-antitoxin system prevent-host-death family antitoxin [Melioribacteraceae bacterium]
METIAVSNLRAKIMTILKKVENGSIIKITSRGKIVAKLVPPDFTKKRAEQKLIEIGESAKFIDITSPIEEVWNSDNS